MTSSRRPSRSLIALLMLGLGAMAQAAPRAVPKPGAHPAHPAAPRLNTTLPVPEITGARVPPPDGHGAIAPAWGDPVAAEDARHENAHGAFAIHWRESREIAGPEIVSRIRNFKRDGLPVVQFWESGQSRVAIGLSSHGVPGIYFTHHVGG